jgi:hypothetical protein
VEKIAGKEGAGEGEKGQKGRTNEKDAQKTRFRGFERRLGGRCLVSYLCFPWNRVVRAYFIFQKQNHAKGSFFAP